MSNTKTVFTCIDKRFDNLVCTFYKETGQENDYYLATAAGASLPLSYNTICKKPQFNCCTTDNCKTNRTLRNGLLTNFSISQALSEIVQLDIMDHQDCGAFRVFLPCANLPPTPENLTPAEKEKEKEVHGNSLNLAETKVRQADAKFTNPIRKLLMDLNGTVAEFDGEKYTVIFKGQGENTNGLFYED